jgi:hypothetical protein
MVGHRSCLIPQPQTCGRGGKGRGVLSPVVMWVDVLALPPPISTAHEGSQEILTLY